MTSIPDNLFRTVFNQSAHFMAIIGTDGKVLDMNFEASNFAGKSMGSMIGSLLWNAGWWHVNWVPEVQKSFYRAVTGTGASFVASVIDTAGEMRCMEFSIKPVVEDGRRIDCLIVHGHDVTQRKLTEDQFLLNASVFENTTEGIIITDPNGIIEAVNPAFSEITGYSADEVLGKHSRILKSGRQSREYYQMMWDTISGSEGKWKGEFWNLRKDGTVYPQESAINAVRDEQGTIRYYIGIFSDITERKKLEEQLVLLSTIDGLTGLANRRSFDEALEKEWRRSARSETSLALIMADVDCFKNYNDSYGHLRGDDCLKSIACKLQAALRRPGDLAARYGGEEFALLLPLTNSAAAVLVAERLRAAVQELAIPHKSSIASSVVTLSLGTAALVPTPNSDPSKLIAMADCALYQAKESGRNRVMSKNDT